MHTISDGLREHIATGGRLFRCVRITRKDGAVIRLCNSPVELTVNDELYTPCPSGNAAHRSSADENAGDTMLEALFDETLIDRHDVLKGLYDRAETEIRCVAPPPSAEPAILMFKGTIGAIRYDNNVLRAELISIADLRNTNIVSRYSPYCRAAFGDAACGIDKNALTFTATIDDSGAGNTIALTASPEHPAFFAHGICRFTSGENTGFTCAISSITAGTLTLKEYPPFAFTAGDQLHLTQGCDKRFTTCVERYNNAVNFRGEPHLPGASALV